MLFRSVLFDSCGEGQDDGDELGTVAAMEELGGEKSYLDPENWGGTERGEQVRADGGPCPPGARQGGPRQRAEQLGWQSGMAPVPGALWRRRPPHGKPPGSFK